MKLLRFVVSSLLILYSLPPSVYADSQCDNLTEHSLDTNSLQLSLRSLFVGNSYYDGEFAYFGVINDKRVWKLLKVHQPYPTLPAGCQSKVSLTGNNLVLSVINTSNNSGKYSATFELAQQGADYYLILKDYTPLNNTLTVDDRVIPPFNPNAPFPGLITPLLDALIPELPKLAEYRDAALAAESTALNNVVDDITTKFGGAKNRVAKSWSASAPGAVASQFINLTGGIGNSNEPYTGSKTEAMSNGTLSVSVETDGNKTTELVTKVDLPILLMQGNSKISLTGSVCPDAGGKVEFTVKFSTNGQAGSDGVIQYEHNLEAKVKASVDDDANLINSDFDVKQATRSTNGGRQSYVESGLSGQIGASLTFTDIKQTGTQTNEDALRGLSLASGALVGARNFWEHGGCIEINATSPGKVAPGATSKIPVSVKHKKDGSSVPAKVTVELAGGASVQPAVIKPSPGEIMHVATSEKGKDMTITLKASSRRGKDTKVLNLTTKEAPTYQGAVTFSNFFATNGNIDVIWTLTEEVDGIRKYIPSGILNADINLDDCEPLHVTLPIPNHVGNVLIVNTENAATFKNTYQLNLGMFSKYMLTLMCGNSSSGPIPMPMPASFFELSLGGCLAFEHYPFSDEGVLEGKNICPAIGVDASWRFSQ